VRPPRTNSRKPGGGRLTPANTNFTPKHHDNNT
jgi:hypothetical protein